MYKAALASIQAICGFSSAELDMIAGIMQQVHLPAGEFLLKKGETSLIMYYLHKGSARHYYIHETDDIDNDVTIGLYTPGAWITDHFSFTSRQSSRNNIVAFEDCELAALHVEGVHKLIATSQVFLKLGMMLNKVQLTHHSQSLLSAEERYLDLLNNNPQIIQAFPLKYIASYLRITPETISRIRSRIK